MNITRLLQAVEEVELDIESWQADDEGDGVNLIYRDEVMVSVQPEWADFMTEAPSSTSVSPGTDAGHRLALPTADASRPKTTRKTAKEPKPLGMCPECFNVLNPDRTCPMECDQ